MTALSVVPGQPDRLSRNTPSNELSSQLGQAERIDGVAADSQLMKHPPTVPRMVFALVGVLTADIDLVSRDPKVKEVVPKDPFSPSEVCIPGGLRHLGPESLPRHGQACLLAQFPDRCLSQALPLLNTPAGGGPAVAGIRVLGVVEELQQQDSIRLVDQQYTSGTTAIALLIRHLGRLVRPRRTRRWFLRDAVPQSLSSSVRKNND